ncbi:MAG: hypothetical protein KJS97_12155 [Alphaproteobacteria bacterium]|nr:hypothetical protein [Alphaproteobacteria bacterium]
MFVGHYGPALALAGGRKGPSLAVACVAVQLVDFAWSGALLAGIEHARVVPGFTALSPLDLYDMPYTHALASAFAWAAGAALLYGVVTRAWVAAALVGVCVISHWLLDWVVHKPDLILWGDVKVGLGLWDAPAAGVAAEFGVLALGFVAYMTRTAPKSRLGAVAPWAFFALLAAMAVINWLGPTPPDSAAVAMSALAVYVLTAVLAAGLDRVRTARPAG